MVQYVPFCTWQILLIYQGSYLQLFVESLQLFVEKVDLVVTAFHLVAQTRITM